MPTGIYKRSEKHSKAISEGLMGHPGWGGRYSVHGEGICHACGIRKFVYDSYKCKECSREHTLRRYYENPQKVLAYRRTVRTNLQKIIYEHYGNKCDCCGETEQKFFNIDHINNDGKRDRIRPDGKTRSHTSILKKIIKENFPKDLRILCYNCNMGRQKNGGICPHKMLKDSTPK